MRFEVLHPRLTGDDLDTFHRRYTKGLFERQEELYIIDKSGCDVYYIIFSLIEKCLFYIFIKSIEIVACETCGDAIPGSVLQQRHVE